ncbi:MULTISPECIES: hypothetical protein [Micromonospora]|uniref:Uncharacterized protein n=1 Tax=Micromonospora solifontis TaxID=2487138 RepID=A0ABX9WIJ7_9ACTN|nr:MULTISPECIES: hypothetical protein [Micromonospora]NES12511.1 hypothetical protein [Micromonospora sp. PPF5-17B]NES36044.1 hypothetical protein [Micromonospora solifontis]NES54604.1 hypothetical protein [Micromonospora sp. PPF5-6]RNL99966.1 hypothetical protein EFE23_07665 [Micromonospora solifontis]
MDLTPQEYRCADHDLDLTELVQEQLAERTPALMGRQGKQFRVIVTCPGGPGSSSHRLSFTGTVQSR